MCPILFNLFINDINEIFDARFCHPVTLGNIKLSNPLYVDDLILISEIKTGLQSCLDNLQAYCQKWKLIVNNKNGCGKKTILSSNTLFQFQKRTT